MVRHCDIANCEMLIANDRMIEMLKGNEFLPSSGLTNKFFVVLKGRGSAGHHFDSKSCYIPPPSPPTDKSFTKELRSDHLVVGAQGVWMTGCLRIFFSLLFKMHSAHFGFS